MRAAPPCVSAIARPGSSYPHLQSLRRRKAPFDEPPRAPFADDLAISVNQPATHVHLRRAAVELHPLVGCVVHVTVPVLDRRCRGELRIPQYDVRVGAGGQGPLSRVRAVDARLVGGEDGDELVLGELPLADAERPEGHGAFFCTRQSVGDQGEVVFAELLLFAVVERAVIRAEDLEVPELEAVPQRGPVPRVAQRWGADVLGALETLTGEILVLEGEVLGAGLGVDRLATLVGQVNGLQGRSARDVDDQYRCTRNLGEPYRPVRSLGLDGLGTGEDVEAGGGIAA